MTTSISFVLPMYNESQTIAETIERLSAMARSLTKDYEIIVANDASQDESGDILDKVAEKNMNVTAIHLEKNTKFGGALKAGLKKAKKDIIVYTDSDLPIDIDDLKSALSSLETCDILTASSTVEKAENLKRVIMSKVYNFLVQSLFATDIKDINSGFKIYKRPVFNDMELISNSPFIDVEIFVRAKRKNCTIREFPIVFKRRKGGVSYISRPAVVLATLIDMFKFKFVA